MMLILFVPGSCRAESPVLLPMGAVPASRIPTFDRRGQTGPPRGPERCRRWLGFQGVYGVALAIASGVPLGWVLAGWIALVPLTASLIAATNVATLAGSKGMGVTLLHLLFYAANAVLLTLVVGVVRAVGGGPGAVIAALVLVQSGVLVGMVALLGAVFGAVDAAEDAPP
jgi:hypothetical protein